MGKQVKDQSSMHRYRTEIPNIIDDMDLSVYAFRLYVRLKRVAGDDGKCFYSTRELAQQCKMSVGAVSKAKQELADADLIRIERAGDWERDNITVTDMWPANFAHFAHFAQEKQEAPCSPHEQDCSHSEQAVHHMNTSVHQVNTIYIEKEEPLKEEPIKNVAAAQPLPEKTPTPQQELFGAVCEAVGWDYNLLSKDDKGQVAQFCGVLQKNNYTVDDIRRFITEFWFKDWRWEKNQKPPTLKQLRQEIGIIRSVIPAAAPPPPKPKGVTSLNRLAASIGRGL